MGRVKSSIPQGNFVIRTKPNPATGEVAIYLSYIVNSKPVPRSTGIKIKPSEWDSINQRITSDNPAAARLNNILRQKRAILDRLVHHSLRVELFGESIRKTKSENAYE